MPNRLQSWRSTRLPPHRGKAAGLLILLSIPVPILLCSAPAAAAKLAEIRAGLESMFRAQTGLGFIEFGCDLPPGGSAASVPEFSCDARDEEGDRFLFRIWRDGERDNVSMWQPVEQLAQAPLATLLQPISAFLQRFGAAQWSELHADLADNLKQQLDLDAASAMLAPMQRRFGAISAAEPRRYNAPGPGQHLLEYELQAAHGPVSARFQLVLDAAGVPRIAGFVLVPQTGSELAGQMLGESAAASLAPQLGPIRRVVLPPGGLRRIGDVVEGHVVLESGEEIAVVAAQTSTSTDFRTQDYGFAVIELGWMIRHHLAQQGDSEASVACPQRSVADGGRVVCTVTTRDGSVQHMEVMRQGGGHRMRVVESRAD
jgi:hypothetical protein